MSADPYLYPQTTVLRNIPGERDPRRAEQLEADLSRLRLALLARRRIEGQYDLAHLQAFHRHLFTGFYDWAGELRTVDIAKTASFCLVKHMRTFASDVFARLGPDLLGTADRAEFVDQLAHHLGEVNALHPFREGNGRAQRAFFAQLAGDAGYFVDWRSVDKLRNDEASRAAMVGDVGPLRDLLDEIVVPLGQR